LVHPSKPIKTAVGDFIVLIEHDAKAERANWTEIGTQVPVVFWYEEPVVQVVWEWDVAEVRILYVDTAGQIRSLWVTVWDVNPTRPGGIAVVDDDRLQSLIGDASPEKLLEEGKTREQAWRDFFESHGKILKRNVTARFDIEPKVRHFFGIRDPLQPSTD
jgi:hypothetical protein